MDCARCSHKILLEDDRRRVERRRYVHTDTYLCDLLLAERHPDFTPSTGDYGPRRPNRP